MKYINRIGMMVVAGLGLAATSCSDYSDYNSVPSDANAMAEKSLYENISENANLKDFASIINKANYGKALDAPQCYTLWAPLDGTYDAQSILAMDSAKIVDRFINMHIAQFSHPVSGEVDKSIITLNDKHHTFSNTEFDGLAIKDSNIPSTNGLIHTINGISEYFPNVYEYLDEVEDCDSFANYIHSYDIPYIDKRKSIEGPMVNGQQTYLDTVWAKRNTVIRQILRADIEDEDSSFVVLFPTNDAWVKAVDRISPLYQYISPVNYMDVAKNTTPAGSLKAGDAKAEKPVQIDVNLYNDSLPKSHIMRNLAFSNSYKRNEPLLTGQSGRRDSIYSASFTKLSNVEEVLSHCGELRSMSNGYVRTLDSLCYKPWETFEPIRGYSNPIRTLGLKSGANYTRYSYSLETLLSQHIDMLSEVPVFIQDWMFPEGSNFLSYLSTDSVNLQIASSKPELAFALKNVLSTKYHIYVVLVPSQLKEPERPVSEGSTEIKNLYLRFDMSYTDEKGTQKIQRLNVPGAKASDDILVVNDGKFHVVELEFTFPICYAGLDAFPTLFMSHTKSFTSSGNRKKWEQELRVEGVYLVPEGAYNYLKR